jgi:hypothetical protein
VKNKLRSNHTLGKFITLLDLRRKRWVDDLRMESLNGSWYCFRMLWQLLRIVYYSMHFKVRIFLLLSS